MSVTIKSDGTVDSTRVYDETGREIEGIENLEILVDAKKNIVRATITMVNPKFEVTAKDSTVKESKKR